MGILAVESGGVDLFGMFTENYVKIFILEPLEYDAENKGKQKARIHT